MPVDHTTLAPAGSIGVVWLDLDQPRDVVDALALLLDEAEEQRISRLAVPTERRRAIVRLARRRQVLADILHATTKDVEALPGQDTPGAITLRGDTLFVSASHCDDVGLIAVTRERKVGVDVEAAHKLPDPDQFAQWVAASEELHELNELAPADRTEACLRLWTRKEAYLKATGVGIGDGLNHVRVPLQPESWAHVFRPVNDGQSWLLFELASPRVGLNASLVTEFHERIDPRVIVTRR